MEEHKIELATALRASMEELGARQQAESGGKQVMAAEPATPGGTAEEESGEEAPLQRARDVTTARGTDVKEQMTDPGAT